MSLRVLVIPEDFRKDELVLKPLFLRMMKEVGRPRAKVRVCRDPLLGGIGEALKWKRIEEILARYVADVDVFLLIVDRDGHAGRRTSLDAIESQASEFLMSRGTCFGECAWQEVEAWALAGQVLPADWKWTTIRDERDVKEMYFVPLAKDRGSMVDARNAYAMLGREAAANYDRVLSRCEEIRDLQQRIADWLGARSP